MNHLNLDELNQEKPSEHLFKTCGNEYQTVSLTEESDQKLTEDRQKERNHHIQENVYQDSAEEIPNQSVPEAQLKPSQPVEENTYDSNMDEVK